MLKEDSQRPAHLSRIDLNQSDSDTGRDVIMHLIQLYFIMWVHERWIEPPIKRQFDDVVWARIMKLLDVNGEDQDADANGDDDSGSHRVRYDVTRRDVHGRTALHHACMTSSAIREGCCIYRLAERLLELGVDPNAESGDGVSPYMLVLSSRIDCQTDESLPMVKHFQAHGADINGQSSLGKLSCMGRLVSCRRRNLLRAMYQRLPYYMSAIDYSLLGKVGERLVTVAELAGNLASNASNAEDRGAYNYILILIKTEREKQYAAIRSLLQQCIPLHLNQHTDLTDIIFSFIAARDYEK